MNAPLPLVGHVPALPFAAYRSAEAMSASGAQKMLRSPMHYLLDRQQPSEPTPAMQFGSAVHVGVLERQRFEAEVVRAPDVDRRTKDGKAEWLAFQAANADRIVLSAADFDRCRRVIDAVHAHPAAADLLAGAETEGSVFWTDRQYQVPCKMRFDARNYGGLIDLKTCQDASADGFGRAIANFQYHLQAAHYFNGHEHAFDRSPEFWIFIAVESEPPHAVAVYQLDTPSLLVGAHLAGIALERYAAALASGEWPGYPPQINRINVPAWALRVAA